MSKIKVEPISKVEDQSGDESSTAAIGRVFASIANAGGGQVRVDEVSSDTRMSPLYGIAVSMANQMLPQLRWSKRLIGNGLYIVGEPR